MKIRVVAYIDGFNLYFGLREAGLRRYYWLDVVALSTNLLKPYQELIAVKYFTSRVSGAHPADSPTSRASREASRLRQGVYLDALASLPGLEIIEGKFLAKSKLKCIRCGGLIHTFEEKMTDVNIATHLLIDAHQNTFDTALLISADSDLVPPVKIVGNNFPGKRVVVAFPPKRWSNDLAQAATARFNIGNAVLAKSQLPNLVQLSRGNHARRPPQWY